MDIDVELKNYRCFPDENLASFVIRPGFTAFVGPNNSGKSSLLKFLFEFRNLFEQMSAEGGDLQESLRGNRRGFNLRGLYNPREVFSNTNSRDIELKVGFRDQDYQPQGGRPPVVTEIAVKVARPDRTWTATEITRQDGPLTIHQDNHFMGNAIMRRGTEEIADLAVLLRACRMLAQCMYVGPFRNAINIGGRDEYFDIKVGQQFIQAWRQYKMGMDTAQNEAMYTLTQDIRELFGFNDLEINPTPADETLQVFIDGKSYKLPELGSGIAQFIIVLANTAIKRPSFVLIDEPELNLHPSLQLSFLTTLTSYATEGTLFGTHSLGLARASAERIYSLRRLSEGRSEIRPYDSIPDLAQFLGELGYSAYRELGIEKVLLVEGPSDLRSIQQFLRKYGKEHSALLLQLGGASLINANASPALAEVQRISGHVHAVIDSEKAGANDPIPGDRFAFRQVCQNLGINCHILDRRALDNYFPDSAVKRVKGGNHRALAPYERLADVSPAWAKAEGWRIAFEMAKNELDGTDLGAFLTAL